MARFTRTNYSLPSAQPAGTLAGNDGSQDQYGASDVGVVMGSRNLGVLQGDYFTAQNATPGTGIALNAQIQSFAATNGLFVFNNSDSTKYIIMDYLELILTAATTAVVSVDFQLVLDTVTRNPSTAANGTAVTGVNANLNSTTAAALRIQAYNAVGAMTIPSAGGSARTLGRVHVATGLHVVGDSIRINFGERAVPGMGALSGATRTSSSAPATFVVSAPPLVIPPLQWAVVHRWSLTEAGAPTYEYHMGWWEK